MRALSTNQPRTRNKPIDMEQLNGKAKEEFIIVAVITPKFTDYLGYIREQQEENTKYTHVCNLKSVLGRLYDRVEKLHNYYTIEDISDVMEYLETHVKSNREGSRNI